MTTCCAKSVFVACEAMSSKIRELEAKVAAAAAAPAEAPAPPGSDLAAARAAREAAVNGLAEALRILSAEGGYRPAPRQARIRALTALCLDLGGSLETTP